ncbi:conserved hypothetical protein [Plasmopara halstedii]|uniref:Calcineurin-like phosphoesterase domain-containing protein n=1 Tax=Plasmopara halstedii TaxID=4781 RepID=A0A0P1ANR2_PLAHL|nr:conserved hypothetical protein [Plasmopara halstedii]CEG42885.1 conserved hypothetical protein [Plasmopara halstedii]|eukprot:XP_024579254.1 conserved hypothetical protein [Plasmopara halstedii]
MVTKRVQIIGVVVTIAVIGVIAAIILTRQSDSSSVNNESSGPNVSDSASGTSGDTDDQSTGTSSENSTNEKTGTKSKTSSITSDPTSAKFSLAAFAVGDWGTTIYQDSCCTRSDTFNNYDILAEDVVASIMNTQAGNADIKPKAILGHGDNFYWTGINSEEGRDSRFATTFEKKFSGENIASIPFINVLGNHDYGGGSYICHKGDENAKCNSPEEIVEGLENKFKWQQEYTSPNDNRWILKDHFYSYTIADEDSGVSIEIFNIDTGDADVHAAIQVCCQCYAYSGGSDNSCDGVARGHKFCAGGDNDLYDACFAKFEEWGSESRKLLVEHAAASNATWMVVNSHYSPHVHYDPEGVKEWFKILKDSGIHAWIYGHTHGEKHDYSESHGIHFVENGAGGGIQKEAASGITTYAAEYAKNVWTYSGDEYGFFSLEASAEWMMLQYHTADKAWSFGSTMGETTVGGVETKHCWYIPADGGEGQECTS